MGSQVLLEAISQRDLKGVSHQIKGQRVHADDDERKRPALPLAHIDEVMNRRQNQEAATAAEQRPGRCPEVLNDRANTNKLHRQADGDAGCASDDETLRWLSGLLQPRPRH